MAKTVCCIVPGCKNPAHARGYCRKHYGQIWRRGMIYSERPDHRRNPADSRLRREDADRLRAMERELRRALEMYNGVVGVAGRIRWRKELEMLELQIQEMNEKTKNAGSFHHEQDSAN